MITQKDLRQKLGENGRKWVESEVSLSAVAKKMAATLEQLPARSEESVTMILRSLAVVVELRYPAKCQAIEDLEGTFACDSGR